jgi:hypothetical protein
MKTNLVLLVLCGVMLASCGKEYGEQSLGGTTAPMGEVGNTFELSNIDGVSNVSAKITELNDGVSKLEFMCDVTDSKLKAMAQYIPEVSLQGNKLTATSHVKMTDQGIMNVLDEGNLILVKYDAKVGDTYSIKRDGKTVTREVTAKSTENDFFWSWMLIKTIDVEETGQNIPGVSKLVYHTNHKFGLVAVNVFFEDGTSKMVSVYSNN